MNTNKLLAVAVLAAAIGAPIAGFIGDTKGQSIDVHRSARSVPSRIPDWSVCQSGGASVAHARR